MFYRVCVRISGRWGWMGNITQNEAELASVIGHASRVYGSENVRLLSGTDAVAMLNYLMEINMAEIEGTVPGETYRRALEHGKGGDHNSPYAFTLPRGGQVLSCWCALFARVRCGEFGSEPRNRLILVTHR